MPATDLKDFFVSYNRADKVWAEWIAWTLEEAGYSVLIQAWDFRPGGNFVLDMQRAAAGTSKTIAVLSDAYLKSAYTQPEWAAAFANDPQSLARNLIPIRVADCQPDGMLRPLVYVDLVGLSEADAQQAVLGMLRDRAKPAQKPTFPGAPAAVQHTIPTPPTFPGTAPAANLLYFSTYRPDTWTGREEAVTQLTDAIDSGSRLLILHGMTGIGKTALAEKLAADSLAASDTPLPYRRIAFDVGTISTDFTRGALTILQALGDDTAQQLPDEQILPYLIKNLEQRPHWLQLDSLEYLLHQSDDGSYHFADAAWVECFVQLLNSPRNQTCLVLTSQALPADLVDRLYRYDQLWYEYPLRGLEAAHWLDLFRNYSVTPTTDAERDHLCHIAHYFDGHPLILKMIAGDIRSRLFGGSIGKYWGDYYCHQQPSQRQSQTAAPRQSQEQRVRQWVNQTIQQLPDLPRQMLQRSAVFRRPVAEAFYLQMLEEGTDSDRTAALNTLKSRNLVEEKDILAGQLLIQQHNLIRDSAYAQLKTDSLTWESAERTAAHLWLTAYTPAPDTERIETVRGSLEAFDHYCEVEDWDAASEIYTGQLGEDSQVFHWQLSIWGYYKELIRVSSRLINKISSPTKRICLNQIGNSHKNLGDVTQSIEFYQQALDFSRETGDRTGEGRALGNLGSAYYSQGQYEQAIAHYQQYLTIAREIGDRQGEGAALGNLGIAYDSQGQYEQAIAHYQQCLTIAREIGDRQGEGAALGNLGNAYESQGQYEQAIAYHQQDLTIAREIGDRQGEGAALGNLGNAYYAQGQYEQAIAHHQQRLTIAREIGDRRGEGKALGNLGNAYHAQGQYEQAIAHYQQSLTIAREIGDRQGEGNALGSLGNAYNSQGQYEQAIAHHQQYLTIAREIGDRRGEGIALGSLGNAYYSQGQYEQAIAHDQQHLTIAREIGDRRGEGIALVNWGQTQIKLEHYPDALENTNAALAIFREIGFREGEAEALKNLAELHQKLGEAEVARGYCEQALALATELGIPLVEECQQLKALLVSQDE